MNTNISNIKIFIEIRIRNRNEWSIVIIYFKFFKERYSLVAIFTVLNGEIVFEKYKR